MTESVANDESDDIAIGFSTEELVVLSELLGQRVIPGLGPDPLGHLNPDSRAVAVRTALHGLIARRIVRNEDGRTTVLDAIASLLTIASAPAILAHVLYESSDLVETRMFAARPEVSVEHTPLNAEVHRLSPFATDHLLVRVLKFCRLDQRPAIECKPFDITVELLRACGDAVAAGDSAAATATVVVSGAESESANAFVNALCAKRGSARVAFVYRPGEQQLAGGELAWLDGGEYGLWLTSAQAPSAPEQPEATPRPGLDTTSIRIGPTTAQWIATELLSYLPASTDTGK